MPPLPASPINSRTSAPVNSALSAVTGFNTNASFNNAMSEANAARLRSQPPPSAGEPARPAGAPQQRAGHGGSAASTTSSGQPTGVRAEPFGNRRLAKAPPVPAPAPPPTVRASQAGQKNGTSIADGAGEQPAIVAAGEMDFSAAEPASKFHAGGQWMEVGLAMPDAPGLTPLHSVTAAAIANVARGRDGDAAGHGGADTDADAIPTGGRSGIGDIDGKVPPAAFGTDAMPRRYTVDNLAVRRHFADDVGRDNGGQADAGTHSNPVTGAQINAATTRPVPLAESKPQKITGMGLEALNGFAASGGHSANALHAPPATPSLAAPAAGQIPTALDTPLGQPGWANELGAAAIRLLGRDIAEATLKINPRHLGPIEIAIDVEGGGVSVAFVAATPEARQALEQSLPQLAQMMSDAGISLTGSSVNERRQSDRQEQRASLSAGRHADNKADDQQTDVLSATRQTRVRLGNVDTYA